MKCFRSCEWIGEIGSTDTRIDNKNNNGYLLLSPHCTYAKCFTCIIHWILIITLGVGSIIPDYRLDSSSLERLSSIQLMRGKFPKPILLKVFVIIKRKLFLNVISLAMKTAFISPNSGIIEIAKLLVLIGI